jgi:hypothetical protein
MDIPDEEGEGSAFTLFPANCIFPDDGVPVLPKHVTVLTL